MAIAAAAPPGGIVADLGGRVYPLLLRNAEIERFEVQHDLGIFAMLDRLLRHPGAPAPHARHIRDLVALGLVGGGMPDRAADDIIAPLPPSANGALRIVAFDLILAAFLPETTEKKSGEDGSAPNAAPPADAGAWPSDAGT